MGAFAACGSGNSDETTNPTSTAATDTTSGINDTSRMSSGSTTAKEIQFLVR